MGGMARRGRGWAVALLLLLLATGGFAVLLVPHTIGCGDGTVLVTGRLLDAATGAPVADALVVCFPDRDSAADPKRSARPRDKVIAHLAETAEAQSRGVRGPPPLHFYSGGRTDAEGRFRFLVRLGFSSTTSLAGVTIRREEPSPGKCSILRVEAEGRRAAVVQAGPEGWRRTRYDDSGGEVGEPPRPGGGWESYLFARFDMGDLRLPASE